MLIPRPMVPELYKCIQHHSLKEPHDLLLFFIRLKTVQPVRQPDHGIGLFPAIIAISLCLQYVPVFLRLLTERLFRKLSVIGQGHAHHTVFEGIRYIQSITYIGGKIGMDRFIIIRVKFLVY